MSYPIPPNDDGSFYRQTYEEVITASQRKHSWLPTSVATLAGENPRTKHITCSMVIAKECFPETEIHGFASFEEAKTSVLIGESDVLLVPAGYPKVFHFIQCVDLEVIDTFIMPIPALVFAGKTPQTPSNPTTLYTHPSPAPLADGVLHFQRKELCSSNEQVVLRLIEDSDMSAVCITNKVAAEFMELKIYSELLTPKMPWILFRKK
jgi:prephenate dehydratase